MKLNVSRLSQNDDRWRAKKIPGAGTIGLWGCYLTSICMQLQFMGYDYTPDTLNEAFKVSGIYTSGGLIRGDMVATLFNGTFGKEDYTNTPAPMDKIRAIIDSGRPVVCEVDFYKNTSGKEQHFVLIVGYTDTSLLINDSWDGQEYFIEARYPNPNPSLPKAEHAVMGLRIYDFPSNKPPEPEPTEVDKIIRALKEKGLDTYDTVIKMCDTWQKDFPNAEKQIKELQKALLEKQTTLKDKDDIISNLQTVVTKLERQIKIIDEAKERMAQSLDCSPDWAIIETEVREAAENETKVTVAEERARRAEENYNKTYQQLTSLDGELTKLEGQLKTSATEVARLEKIVAQQKKIIELKKVISLKERINKWLKEKFNFLTSLLKTSK